MCKCTPNLRTPFCGKPGCQWPHEWESDRDRAIRAYPKHHPGFPLLTGSDADNAWVDGYAAALADARHSSPTPQTTLNANEVMERFCALQEAAADFVGHQYAADCFCRKGGFWGSPSYDGTRAGGYRNDGEALKFIETALREKIARSRGGRHD